MVKKLGENDKPIEAKPKAVRRRYVRKLNKVLPKLDVQDFLPKLKGKTATDLKREVMKIRETLESEYQELKKKVTERKQKALEALSSKSTETLKKEQITKEKADKVILKKEDESSKVAVKAVLDYIDTKKSQKEILAEVPAYANASSKTKANFMRRLKEEVKKNNGNAAEYVREVRSASAEEQKMMVESVEPLPAVRVLKMTAAERAADGNKKITDYMKPALAMANPLETDSDEEGQLGGEGQAAGFSRIKKHAKEHHNIALIGKEDQMRMGEMSLSVARDIRQLNELKRNHRGVVIRRSDLIDAERPINYELSIM